MYVDQAAVDDELVDIILEPAFTPNALDVFVSVITGEKACCLASNGVCCKCSKEKTATDQFWPYALNLLDCAAVDIPCEPAATS